MTTAPKLREFLDAVDASLTGEGFVKLTLGHYTGNEVGLKAIHIRKIIVKRQEKLSFTYRYKTRDIVNNYAPADAAAHIRKALMQGFGNAMLMTTSFDLTYDGKDLKKAPPSQSEAPSLTHDRQKARLVVAAGQSWLYDLDITDATGAVLKNAQDKYRQINRYVEILGGLVKDLPPEKVRRIVDMGSGKGYLTFALYDYLRNKIGAAVQMTGVEMRPDMVSLCNSIATKAGFIDLCFVENTIDGYDADGIDILIALHACDTATDDAIAKGIKAGAALIVVAPCCHKQVRRTMEKAGSGPDLGFLLTYGIFRERQAEMVTDGLRALILNAHGYDTKVFEFISDAHTPKNVMIVAVKNSKTTSNAAILAEIAAAKNYFGIDRHYLESVLEGNDDAVFRAE